MSCRRYRKKKNRHCSCRPLICSRDLHHPSRVRRGRKKVLPVFLVDILPVYLPNAGQARIDRAVTLTLLTLTINCPLTANTHAYMYIDSTMCTQAHAHTHTHTHSTTLESKTVESIIPRLLSRTVQIQMILSSIPYICNLLYFTKCLTPRVFR